MKLLTPIILFLSVIFTTPIHAQEKAAAAKIKIGSAVLVQEGTDEYCYNNGPYHYEKIYEVNAVVKDELYNRAKAWILSNLKAGDQNQFDDEKKNEIHTTVVLALVMGRVNFKLNLYFKDGKYRLVANNFMFVSESEYGVFNGALNNLKPGSKKWMISVYETFDKDYLNLLASLNSSMTSKTENW